MKLRALGFSPNGRADLVGTVVAYSDAGEPLGAEVTGNWSKSQTKRELLRELEGIGEDLEAARAQLTRLLADLRSSSDEAQRQGPPARLTSERPQVMLKGMRLHEVVDRAWGLLVEASNKAASPCFYRLGDALVELDAATVPMVPRPFTIGGLRLTLDRRADWTTVTAKGDERVTVPPKDALEGMLATPPAPSLPVLEGVVSVPYLAPDGRLVTVEGTTPLRACTSPCGASRCRRCRTVQWAVNWTRHADCS